VSAAGAVTARDDSTEVEGPSIDVPARGEVDDARIVVPRGASIFGRVQDGAGRGVRAFVTVTTRDRKTSKETRASADGTFSIRGFGALPHTLTARPETQWGVELLEVRHAAATIEVGEGDASDVRIVVARADLVGGRVLDGAGVPIDKAGLFAQPVGGLGVTRATTNSLGEFRLWLAEGVEHEIVARVGQRESTTIAVSPGGEPLEIRVP
jgi:hypothetical protein